MLGIWYQPILHSRPQHTPWSSNRARQGKLKVYAKKKREKKEPAYRSGRAELGINEEMLRSMTMGRSGGQQAVPLPKQDFAGGGGMPDWGADNDVSADYPDMAVADAPTYGMFELLLFEEDGKIATEPRSLLKAKQKVAVAGGLPTRPSASTIHKQRLAAMEKRLRQGPSYELVDYRAPPRPSPGTTPALLPRPTGALSPGPSRYANQSPYAVNGQNGGASYAEFAQQLRAPKRRHLGGAAGDLGARPGARVRGRGAQGPAMPPLAAKPVLPSLNVRADVKEQAKEGPGEDDRSLYENEDPVKVAAWLAELKADRRWKEIERALRQPGPPLLGKPTLSKPVSAAAPAAPPRQAVQSTVQPAPTPRASRAETPTTARAPQEPPAALPATVKPRPPKHNPVRASPASAPDTDVMAGLQAPVLASEANPPRVGKQLGKPSFRKEGAAAVGISEAAPATTQPLSAPVGPRSSPPTPPRATSSPKTTPAAVQQQAAASGATSALAGAAPASGGVDEPARVSAAAAAPDVEPPVRSSKQAESSKQDSCSQTNMVAKGSGAVHSKGDAAYVTKAKRPDARHEASQRGGDRNMAAVEQSERTKRQSVTVPSDASAQVPTAKPELVAGQKSVGTSANGAPTSRDSQERHTNRQQRRRAEETPANQKTARVRPEETQANGKTSRQAAKTRWEQKQADGKTANTRSEETQANGKPLRQAVKASAAKDGSAKERLLSEPSQMRRPQQRGIPAARSKAAEQHAASTSQGPMSHISAMYKDALVYERAQQAMDADKVFAVKVVASNNSGGVQVQAVDDGQLIGFVPHTQMASFTMTRLIRQQRLLTQTACQELGIDAAEDLPASTLREIRVKSLATLRGQTLDCAVIAIDPEAARIILSERRAVQLKEERGIRVQRIPQVALDILEEYVGEVLQCVVTNVLDWGVFLDFDVDTGPAEEGGQGVIPVTGLVPSVEVSWVPMSSPKKLIQVGDTVAAMLMSVDVERCVVALSMRVLQPDPLMQSLDAMLPSTQEPQAKAGHVDREAHRVASGDLPVVLAFAAVLKAQAGVQGVEVGTRLQGRAFAQELAIYLAKASTPAAGPDTNANAIPTDTGAPVPEGRSTGLLGKLSEVVNGTWAVGGDASANAGAGAPWAAASASSAELCSVQQYRLVVRLGLDVQELTVSSTQPREDFKATLNGALAKLMAVEQAGDRSTQRVVA